MRSSVARHVPRVALVLPNLMLGGAEHQAVKLLTALSSNGVRPLLVVLQRWLPSPLRGAVPEGTTVVTSPFGRRDPRVVPWVAARLREHRIDVVQTFLWYADVVAALACRRAPYAALVCSERGDRGKTFYGPIRRLLDRVIVFPTTRRFVANSEASIRALVRAGFPEARIELIRNGVELGGDGHTAARALDLPQGALVACMVGSLQPYKGVETFVRAVGTCPAGSRVHAVIVGAGPERTRLESLSRELGIGARIQFVGPQHPPEPWMRAADVGILASMRDEACSNSILEFMAQARPVFATAVGGNPELVVDGTTGRLFPPGDWRALASLLEIAARNRDALREMGRMAAERARASFAISAAASAYTRLWGCVARDTEITSNRQVAE